MDHPNTCPHLEVMMDLHHQHMPSLGGHNGLFQHMPSLRSHNGPSQHMPFKLIITRSMRLLLRPK